METLEVTFSTENEITDGADDLALHQNSLEMDW